MKISELKFKIKEEIISVLKEAEDSLTSKEIEARAEATRDLNKELAITVKMTKELQ